MADLETGQNNQQDPHSDRLKLGDKIMELLSENTENPSEAFVLLQQLSVFLWAQYKIDWEEKKDLKVAPTRKQRYLDFVSGLIDQVPLVEASHE